MTRLRWTTASAVLVSACALAAVAHAAFTATKTNPQTLTSVPDFLPPVAERAQVVGNGVPGAVTPGREYRVYAQVADQGNPPQGTQTVAADVTGLGGPAALALAVGAFTVGGASYNYGSAAQTAPAGLTGPTRPYSLTMTDALAQSSTQSFTVSVQPGCVPVSIDAVNGSGGRVRSVDRRDVIRYTYSVPLKSTSLADWGITSIVGTYLVRIDIDRRSPGAGDVVTVRPLIGGTPTPLGEIDTKANYAGSSDKAFSGTIALSTGNTVVEVVVDSQLSGSAPPQVPGPTRMTWTPVAGVFDAAGGPCATTAVTQPTLRNNF